MSQDKKNASLCLLKANDIFHLDKVKMSTIIMILVYYFMIVIFHNALFDRDKSTFNRFLKWLKIT